MLQLFFRLTVFHRHFERIISLTNDMSVAVSAYHWYRYILLTCCLLLPATTRRLQYRTLRVISLIIIFVAFLPSSLTFYNQDFAIRDVECKIANIRLIRLLALSSHLHHNFAFEVKEE